MKNLESVFNQEYKELFNELQKRDPKEWGIVLPKDIKQEYKSFKIYRIGLDSRSLEGTCLSIDSELHIDWAAFTTEIIDSNLEFSSLVVHFFLFNFFDLQHAGKGQLFSTYFSRITPEIKKNISKKIAEVINNYPWNRLEKVDFEDKQSWQVFIRELQYVHNMFTPLTALHTYFKYCNEYDELSMIMNLNDYAFALFVSMGVYTYKIWSQFNDLILSLDDDLFVAIRLGIYISNMPDLDFEYLKISDFQVLVRKYWKVAGIEFFRKFFCHPNGNYSVEEYSSHKLKFIEIINRWNTEKEYSFIESLRWPNDFQGLVRVLCPFTENEDHQIDFSPELLHSISRNLLNSIQKEEKDDLLSDRFLPLRVLSDPLDRDMFIAICMTMDAIMDSDDGLFAAWKRQLKNWIFFIKPLFYSGYEGKRIAKNTVEIILVFLTSTASLTNVSKSSYLRIKELLDLITTNILYPFIRYTERDEDIWNYDRKLINPDKKYYDSKELYLINHNLKLITKTNNEQMKDTFNDFCSKWKSLSQARWPWFDSETADG